MTHQSLFLNNVCVFEDGIFPLRWPYQLFNQNINFIWLITVTAALCLCTLCHGVCIATLHEANMKQWIAVHCHKSTTKPKLQKRPCFIYACVDGKYRWRISWPAGLLPLQVTQLYVPSARHMWRTRRMGRIGPLQSTLDGNLFNGFCNGKTSHI